MRHYNSNRKFSRNKDERTALLRSLALSLIEKNRIRTTEARAKELRPFIEKLVTKGRDGTLSSRRLIASRLGGNKEVTKKLIDDIAVRYKERAGGYTRITKMPSRISDGSKMAILEFV
ncbi:MAG: 50S ribosomal protein L17 [Candidatus Yonathbacteria bacterium CG_4_10_14_3_um_filter_47_65]|uniref:Large ribosomal subunit protein bL17 n=2 Tax=Parcubacteria group TaxID=1794811 RepID=A0A2M8D5D5_9BACT|nr:MAG: 50S ribosomal protein L17 [Candidatus Nomurabacteria bacterium CG1_02_47_685]PIP03812.1 MAG: 50S ribosomal protein L17 [Candidatus Yonathbacteria bacterium CG23_combo_of_CG06-09_8_20_14_all_46_18]PIQ32530.1 MAG: 50S ribosomal protein L17 [Candidatus Yonathbacteria bacterium CG17_big_fil_post_rev_8_21_14_2_50_46_19]PIX56426.1 MAG: 50S ribosomal protein L17 [Candidatus Yonathbacteria bacterium CG_4_10_14_3_um_filter_47_65]PIY57971.1 MAG: 50S ribosomal protein L17 [Candidatus Yonathbacteri